MSDRFVTVASFQDPVAAMLAKNYLENEGIPAVLIDETTIATDWMLSGAIGGVKLQVAPIHIERAELLLVQVREEQEAAEELPLPRTAIAAQEIAEELEAQREDKAPINQLVDRLYRATVFGLVFWPLQAYAFCLLVQLTGETGTVSPSRRWKVWASVLLSLPIMGTALIVVYWIVGFLFG